MEVTASSLSLPRLSFAKHGFLRTYSFRLVETGTNCKLAEERVYFLPLIGQIKLDPSVRYFILQKTQGTWSAISSISFAELDPYAGGEGLVNCYTSTRTIGMHLRHRATHIRDVTIGLIVLLVH